MATGTRTPRRDVSHLLARQGYRLTGPRLAVADVLAKAREPMTVTAIHNALGADRANIASVYRTINLLAEIGLVRVTDAGHGRQGFRYELNEQFTGHHHHLICQKCSTITDLDGCFLPDEVLVRVSRRVRESQQFHVTEHELRLLGICRRCQR